MKQKTNHPESIPKHSVQNMILTQFGNIIFRNERNYSSFLIKTFYWYYWKFSPFPCVRDPSTAWLCHLVRVSWGWNQGVGPAMSLSVASSHDCWQTLVPCSYRSEVPLSLLPISQWLLSTSRDHRALSNNSCLVVQGQ